ncbi:MAG: hypothetical protein QOF63_2513 [Thermoanaerobaculia bacterium]|jgi:hypothetical protein|nr:hypothetical protein [Thermoanaerobaculia bacterium]MEA2415118.1 hypothetical protein [Thermoanaerobaculia bacterium]
MKRQFLAVVILALALAPAAFAKNDAMSLIPNDSVSVGVVRLADMRSSPLSAALFAQTAHISNDDDAMAFLRDSGLQPTKDIDVIVFATSPRTNLGSDADFLIAADGRFNVDRLSSAIVSRGAVKKASAHGTYFLMPKKSGDSHQGVVAFPDAHLALIGSEAAVLEALASRASGGTTFATTTGLGRDMSRIDAHATAFVLVDVPRAQRITGAPKLGSGSQSQAIGAALKNVSTVAIWATDSGDSLKLSAIGLSSDSETLGLVEDTLRGALSAMRLAVQEQSPDLVSVLRKFTVTRTDSSVSISGSVPAETFKTWVAKSQQSHSSSR